MERGKKEGEDGVGGLFLPLPSEATFGFLADLFHVAACPQAIEEEEEGGRAAFFPFPPAESIGSGGGGGAYTILRYMMRRRRGSPLPSPSCRYGHIAAYKGFQESLGIQRSSRFAIFFFSVKSPKRESAVASEQVSSYRSTKREKAIYVGHFCRTGRRAVCLLLSRQEVGKKGKEEGALPPFHAVLPGRKERMVRVLHISSSSSSSFSAHRKFSVPSANDHKSKEEEEEELDTFSAFFGRVGGGREKTFPFSVALCAKKKKPHEFQTNRTIDFSRPFPRPCRGKGGVEKSCS